MRPSARVLALLLCVSASSPALFGCSRTRATTSAPEPAVPTSVADLDHFAIGLNQFALRPKRQPLPPDALRAARRVAGELKWLPSITATLERTR